MKVIVRDVSKREVSVAMDAGEVHSTLLLAALNAAGLDVCDKGSVSISFEPAVVPDTGEDGVMATVVMSVHV